MSITILGQWVLASGSKHRAKQLAAAGIQAALMPPHCDEALIAGEAPHARALRLAEAKAREVATRADPGAIVIAGDQVAHAAGNILRKPASVASACDQLAAASGRWVSFESAVAIHINGQCQHALTLTRVKFRTLTATLIDRYVNAEMPLDAAGSFYSEAVGGWLVDRIENEDPSALIGLPMLALGRLLRDAGVDPIARLPD
ncbi:Maf family protein [Litorivicinus lipolyticus]|uniref:Maf family protein n=1 Tax=Litorivicinus lipolyticus TaxID=418701 RepID=UPI003B5B7A4A